MHREKLLLIVNPVRSKSTARLLARIVDALRASGMDCDLRYTKAKGHGMELAAEGVAQGFRTIVAVGGDGTMNEVVNGVIGSDTMVSSIPLGAGNDFLRSLGIGTWADACRVLADESFTQIDLGLALYQDEAGRPRQRYYAVLADVGFGSEVVRNTPRRLRHALGGNLGYVISLYRTAAQGRARAHQMRIVADGELLCDEKLLLVEAYNGIYGAGGLKVVPSAKLDDGLLDLFLIREMHWLKVWTLFPRIYRGTHLDHDRALYLRAREIQVQTHEKISVSVDGELIGHSPVTFRVLPGALKIRCPPAVRTSRSNPQRGHQRREPPA
jgi:diacylglycerol kinase (ATP)